MSKNQFDPKRVRIRILTDCRKTVKFTMLAKLGHVTLIKLGIAPKMLLNQLTY